MHTLILEGRDALRIGGSGDEELAASTVHQLMVINRRVQGGLPRAVVRPQGFQAQGNRMRPQALPPRLPPNGAVQRRVEFQACLKGRRMDHLHCGGRLVADSACDFFTSNSRQAGVRRRGLQEKTRPRKGMGMPSLCKRSRGWGPTWRKSLARRAGGRNGKGTTLF